MNRPNRNDRSKNRGRNRGKQSSEKNSAQQQGSTSGNQGRRRRRRPKKPQEVKIPAWEPKPKDRRYAPMFFDTFMAARNQVAEIAEKAKSVDQVNIIIKEEGNMDDPELIQHGKVFAGEAWTLVHTRRVEEGWYEQLQE